MASDSDSNNGAPSEALMELLAPDGYYSYLGIPKTPGSAEGMPLGDEDVVKKNYRRLSLKHHPDRSTGDAETFRVLNRAQKVLTTPQLRKQYDILGLDLDDDDEHNTGGVSPDSDGDKDGEEAKTTTQGIVHEIASMALTTVLQMGVRTLMLAVVSLLVVRYRWTLLPGLLFLAFVAFRIHSVAAGTLEVISPFIIGGGLVIMHQSCNSDGWFVYWVGESLVIGMFTYNSMSAMQRSTAVLLGIALFSGLSALWFRGKFWNYAVVLVLELFLAIFIALAFPVMEMVLEAVLNDKLRKVGDKVRAHHIQLEKYYQSKRNSLYVPPTESTAVASPYVEDRKENARFEVLYSRAHTRTNIPIHKILETMAPNTHLENSDGLGTALPNDEGFFGEGDSYGGAFLPPPLVPIMKNVAEEYEKIKQDPEFLAELAELRKQFIGRPSPIYHCKNLSNKIGGAQIYLKREDLNHTGSHKINHTLGEALLAKKMGKSKLIAETGAGQHGVALATTAALMQMECEIHMGEIDIKKEWPNVRRMQVLGAKVVPATHGGRSLKEAVDSAFGAYMNDAENMFFAIGSTVGPHPFPMMVRDFQAVVGYEAQGQFAELTDGGKPDMLVACVGGGCNSLGLFTAFLEDPDVQCVGVEPAGHGLDKGEGHHSATLTLGKLAVLHGMKCYTLLNKDGDPAPVHSCASGLDYPGVGPQHSFMKDHGRVKYETATDEEVIAAFFELSRVEGIIPALESAHALAYAMKIAKDMPSDKKLLINLSGRGDKDLDYVCDMHGDQFGIGKEGIFSGPPSKDGFA